MNAATQAFNIPELKELMLPNAATQVFNIPELVELILLSLPSDNIHSAITSMRTIYTSQTTTRIWKELLKDSTAIRQQLYLPTPLDMAKSSIWLEKMPFPPSQPNPWIPQLLLNSRSWGTAWPFENISNTMVYDPFGPSTPKYWTFSLEIRREQYSRLPKSGPWRAQLAASPPFTDFWVTRSFYELGSGRAPFVTHLDYNAKKPKSEQKYSKHRPNGVTLGDLVDAYCELFEQYPTARWVMIESLRVIPPEEQYEAKLAADRPTTKMYMPGLSAEKAQDWAI